MNRTLLSLLAAAVALVCAPAMAALYQLDPDHSEVGFGIRHLVINTVRGTFGEYGGSFSLDGQGNLASVQVEIKAASIDTRVAKRDDHLRSADFLETAKYPLIAFRSTSIAPGAGTTFTVTGLLRIREIEKEVRLTGELAGPIKDPWGKQRMGIVLRGSIDRNDFGVSYNGTMESGGLLIDNTVAVHLEAEGVMQP